MATKTKSPQLASAGRSKRAPNAAATSPARGRLHTPARQLTEDEDAALGVEVAPADMADLDPNLEGDNPGIKDIDKAALFERSHDPEASEPLLTTDEAGTNRTLPNRYEEARQSELKQLRRH